MIMGVAAEYIAHYPECMCRYIIAQNKLPKDEPNEILLS